MATRPRLIALLGGSFLFLASAAGAGAASCGAYEDAERTSYRSLSWADFQGPPPARGQSRRAPGRAVAQIYTSIRVDGFEVSALRGPDGAWLAHIVGPCVRAYMLKRQSGRSAEAVHPFQLAHEQRHFDLAWVYARRLSARLASLTARAASAAHAERRLRQAVDRAYLEIGEAHQQAQRGYDRKTKYGMRRRLEARWFAQLEAELARLARPVVLAREEPPLAVSSHKGSRRDRDERASHPAVNAARGHDGGISRDTPQAPSSPSAL